MAIVLYYGVEFHVCPPGQFGTRWGLSEFFCFNDCISLAATFELNENNFGNRFTCQPILASRPHRRGLQDGASGNGGG